MAAAPWGVLISECYSTLLTPCPKIRGRSGRERRKKEPDWQRLDYKCGQLDEDNNNETGTTAAMTTATATTTNEDGFDSELSGIMSAFPRDQGKIAMASAFGLGMAPIQVLFMTHQSKDCTHGEDEGRPVLRKKKCFYDLRDAFQNQQQPVSHNDTNPSERPRQSDSSRKDQKCVVHLDRAAHGMTIRR